MHSKPASRIGIVLGVAAFAAAIAPAQAAEVCNEARKGHSGSYNATDSDPNPPARFKTGLAPIGSVAGLNHASRRSPALSVCEPAGGGDTRGGDTGGGGGDPVIVG